MNRHTKRSLDQPVQRRGIVILQSTSGPSAGIDYTSELERNAPPEVQYRYFAWRRAIFARYDALHMHWPEYWIRNSNVVKRGLQAVLFPILLGRLALTRTPVIRTLHNIQPHERGARYESLLLRLLDRITVVFIRLNKQTPLPETGEIVDIPHGDFSAFGELAAPREAEPGRILFFGHVRRYKGVPELVREFRAIQGSGIALRVTGNAKDASLAEELRVLAEDDPRVSLELSFISDRALASEVRAATLIVLPYNEMHNSGAVFVALSLGRPVLVPASRVADDLASEVGDRWVDRYEGPLRADRIERALQSAEELLRSNATGPNLSDRTWSAVAERHYEAYLFAIRRRGRMDASIGRRTP